MLTQATIRHIDGIKIDRSRPMIICDVDEVVLHFIKGLERYLDKNGMWLHPQSFSLNGNIKKRHNGEAISTSQLAECLNAFFEDSMKTLEPIEGAVDALTALATQAEVVMLTNLPDQFHKDRKINLSSIGLDVPVVANQGPKGPAVDALLKDHRAPAVFIDDIPNYIKSVKEHRPDVHLIHFIQDERFGRHVAPLDYVSLRTDNWQVVHDHILHLINSA
jgi:hypothetical protein